MRTPQSYLVDTYPVYASDRPLGDRGSVPTLHDDLGINWPGAATLLGGIAIVLTPMPSLFYRYGARIRKSCFAPCIDLRVAKYLEEAAAEKEKGFADRMMTPNPLQWTRTRQTCLSGTVTVPDKEDDGPSRSTCLICTGIIYDWVRLSQAPTRNALDALATLVML
jgi:hypothetical protein